jgi:hypothetical protein
VPFLPLEQRHLIAEEPDSRLNLSHQVIDAHCPTFPLGKLAFCLDHIRNPIRSSSFRDTVTKDVDQSFLIVQRELIGGFQNVAERRDS